MTTFGAVSPASSTMASASTVSPASFHNLTNHVILSPSREDVSLTLSPSSSFLSNFPSICTSTSKSSTSSSFPTSTFVYSSDTKENSSCSVNNSSMSHTTAAAETVPNGIVPQNVSYAASTLAAAAATTTATAESTFSSETNANDGLLTSEEKAPTISLATILGAADMDENSSNSNSTQSSSDATNGSTRKKRRRGEDQILMEHLTAIDKSLADGVTNQLKPAAPQSATPSDCKPGESNDGSSQTGGEAPKSKEDSPAFHLRPRRSHKNSGYNSSGSSSPICFLSPVKRIGKQPMTNTQQLLKDTSQQLSIRLFTSDQTTSHAGPSGNSINTNCHPLFIKDVASPALLKMATKPKGRSYSRSIMRDVDVSVFAELITPLELKYNSYYPSNYIAMQIIEIKPLRFVQIPHPNIAGKISSPLLELKTLDINDRFSLSHAKGVFDDSSLSQASSKKLSIFLLGTYALKASELAASGQIVHIVKFRTTKFVKSIKSQPLQPPKKRKVIMSPNKLSCIGEDDNCENYPFHVIVDALDDITKIKEEKIALPETLKEEETLDNPVTVTPESYDKSSTFEAIFHSSQRAPEVCEPSWIPFVSFSAMWQAPKDPKELNKTLYIQQPCIPKFESASRTVKMN